MFLSIYLSIYLSWYQISRDYFDQPFVYLGVYVSIPNLSIIFQSVVFRMVLLENNLESVFENASSVFFFFFFFFFHVFLLSPWYCPKHYIYIYSNVQN